MTEAQKRALANRLLKAWKSLSPKEKLAVKPLLDGASLQLTGVVMGFKRTAKEPAHVAQGLDTANQIIKHNGYVPAPTGFAPQALVSPIIGQEGEIYGFKKYEQLDFGWVESVVVWLEDRNKRYSPFPNKNPPVIPIPDDVSIAITGDWGTGNWKPGGTDSPSAKVAKAITQLQPGVVIHLGDVYYSGTNKQEVEFLVNEWPQLPAGSMSFTLNSNHEMYSGAQPLFKKALANPLFKNQGGYSFFALENTSWVIVCLDTAYFSAWKSLYMNGALDASQVKFLQAQSAKGKNLIVMCHHNALDDAEKGPATNALWQQVKTALGTKMPAYWYWGHVHTGVAYKPQGNTLCRCIGHSAIPWGQASVLQSQSNAGALQWYENKNANDPLTPQRVVNGFAVLELNQGEITENFYDENGTLSWQIKPGAMPLAAAIKSKPLRAAPARKAPAKAKKVKAAAKAKKRTA